MALQCHATQSSFSASLPAFGHRTRQRPLVRSTMGVRFSHLAAIATPATQKEQQHSPSLPHAAAGNNQLCSDQQMLQGSRISHLDRRSALMLGSAAVLQACSPTEAQAISMPAGVNSMWQAVGGGPADLTFPPLFLGRWAVTSKLISVQCPAGFENLPPALARTVRRAQQDDLNQPIQYDARFIRNKAGQVIIDRSWNLVQLMNHYMPNSPVEFDAIKWDPEDPNVLNAQLPGGLTVTTQVTRRSEDQVAKDRIDTSEFYRQTFYSAASADPRVKASQCFTKYRFRDDAAAQSGDDGPGIVATQVVSDYLTAQDGEQAFLQAQNKPVVIYTYRMAMTKRRD